MRLSDLDGKEIVNARDGERLGVFDVRDVVVNTDTGCLEGIVVPVKGTLAIGAWDRRHVIIPWRAVRTVGRDIIIVDLGLLSSGAGAPTERVSP